MSDAAAAAAAGTGTGDGAAQPTGQAAAAAAAAPGAATALEGAKNNFDYVPEKYRVMAADGKTLDIEASLKKTAAGYGELHQKLVAGEGPPKDADAYEAKDLPHGLNFAELRKDPKMGAWLKGAHAKGMSNAQIQHVFSGFAEYLGADHELTAEECVAKLGEIWKDDAARSTNMAAAERAARSICAKAKLDYGAINKAYGNDPQFIQLMAAIGAEMKEDTTVTTEGNGSPQGSIEEQVAAIDKQLRELPPGSTAKRLELNERKVKLFEGQLRGKAA